MFKINIPDREYVLPLDNIDLVFLSQYIQKPVENKVAIWSKTYLDGESKYHQLEIVPEDCQDVNSYIEPTSTYMCHICNLNVPQIYYKEHLRSKIHQIYKKLADKVLENISKQWNMDINNAEIKNNNNSLHYCETCCKAVLVEHILNHNHSDFHTKSVENETLADNFLRNYTSLHDDHIESVETNKLEIQSNNINNSYDHAPQIDKNYIHSNAYKSNDIDVKSKKTFCVVCNKYIDTHNFLAHSKTKKHTEAAFNNMKGHQITTENNGTKTTVIDEKYIDKSNTSSKATKINKNAGKTFCDVCDRYIHTHNFLAHTKASKHVIAKRKTNQANNVVTKPNGADVLNVKYPKSSTNSRINVISVVNSKMKFCDVCNRYIDAHNYKAHTKASKHIKAKKKISQPNVLNGDNNFATVFLVQDKNKQTYCELCKVHVPKGGLLIHEKGKPHKKKMRN